MSILLRALRKLRVDGLRPVIKRAWDLVNKTELVEFNLRGFILPWKISHIHGLPQVNYAADELLVACVDGTAKATFMPSWDTTASSA